MIHCLYFSILDWRCFDKINGAMHDLHKEKNHRVSIEWIQAKGYRRESALKSKLYIDIIDGKQFGKAGI